MVDMVEDEEPSSRKNNLEATVVGRVKKLLRTDHDTDGDTESDIE